MIDVLLQMFLRIQILNKTTAPLKMRKTNVKLVRRLRLVKRFLFEFLKA